MEKVVGQGFDAGWRLEELRREHEALELRLSELEHHVSHSPEELLEIARIKKRKLLTKDRIALLGRNGNA